MSIFKKGVFTSHSGVDLLWKIDCDDLTDQDLGTLAYIVSCKFTFNSVTGIPTGGTRFAKSLTQYITKTGKHPLIVDDVLTTGKSMNKFYEKLKSPAIGVVIFSRIAYPPAWVFPIFKLMGTFN